MTLQKNIIVKLHMGYNHFYSIDFKTINMNLKNNFYLMKADRFIRKCNRFSCTFYIEIISFKSNITDKSPPENTTKLSLGKISLPEIQ